MHFKTRLGVLTLTSIIFASCGTVLKTSIVSMPTGAPLAIVDDSLFGRVLSQAVAWNGAVSYKSLQSDSDLTEYLRQIALVHTDAFTSRSELLAFWINVHNAYVLDLLRLNPARSIDDIPGFRYAKVILMSDGQTYSLYDIEHTIIEHHFREPRAFFALFDGTRSSPQLRIEPYSGEHLSDQLDDQFHKFLADSTKNYLDRRANTLYLSKVFQDYAGTLEDMTGESIKTLVRDFGPPDISQWIGGHSALIVSYLRYDNTIFRSDFGLNNTPTNVHPRTPSRGASGGIR
jgi:hypothetical protein